MWPIGRCRLLGLLRLCLIRPQSTQILAAWLGASFESFFDAIEIGVDHLMKLGRHNGVSLVE